MRLLYQIPKIFYLICLNKINEEIMIYIKNYLIYENTLLAA